jgi:four helix bundle protein
MGNYKDLQAYQISFELACIIHLYVQSFPKIEQYSLTDQIRRSSRSTCANIVEAYRKRRYPKYFISKLSDADGENSETILWLDFAKRFNYMDEKTYIDLTSRCSSIGNLLNYMMKNHDKFC